MVLPSLDVGGMERMTADLAETDRRSEAQAFLALPTRDLPTTTAFCQVFAVSRGDTVARSAIVRTPPARE